MAIDRAFSLPGIGLVVTGTAASGRVQTGDRLVLSPSGIAVRVRGLHAQNRAVASAQKGERLGVNIAGSFPPGGERGRGEWLLASERHAPTSRIALQLRVSRFLASPLRDGLPVHLHLGTADIRGRLGILEGRELAPGGKGFVRIDLERSLAALWGDRAILRDDAQRRTLAGGFLVDPFLPRRGWRGAGRAALFEAMAQRDPAAAMSRLLAIGGFVDFERFLLSRNLAPSEEEALQRNFLTLGAPGERIAITGERLAGLAERVQGALGEWHRKEPDALGRNRALLLRELSKEGPQSALEAALFALEKEGRVVREGPLWRLYEHHPRFLEADERLWQRVRPLLAAGELRSLRLLELAEALGEEARGLERFLLRAERFGRVVRAAPNRFFLPETIGRLAEIARELALSSPAGRFTASAFNERSGIGRNLSIEILETFDRIGVTRRIGEARIILGAGGGEFG